MESVGDARSFLSAAREVALRKPIIVIKAGRSDAASKAATSHTGAMTGSDEVFDAALRRCGVLRVKASLIFSTWRKFWASSLARVGPRLTILTNAGGPGVLATDCADRKRRRTRRAFRGNDAARSMCFCPPHWSHGNPIDILGDADPDRYAKALEIAVKDPNSDGLLVILAPQGMTDPKKVAEGLREHAKIHGKPVLASWMGGKHVAEGVATLNAAGIPTFSYPDTAARAFDYLWKFTDNLRGSVRNSHFCGRRMAIGAAREKVGDILRAARIARGVRSSRKWNRNRFWRCMEFRRSKPAWLKPRRRQFRPRRRLDFPLS